MIETRSVPSDDLRYQRMALPERRLFGTDGVRGLANSELTPDLAFELARAAGHRAEGHIVVGRDTRRSGPMLVSALMAGFNSIGVDTVDLGVIPVGGVSRLTRDTEARFGVMVSASHNPAEDNGIKFFGPDGTKLSDEGEDAIERRLRSAGAATRPIGPEIGIQIPQYEVSVGAGRLLAAQTVTDRTGIG